MVRFHRRFRSSHKGGSETGKVYGGPEGGLEDGCAKTRGRDNNRAACIQSESGGNFKHTTTIRDGPRIAQSVAVQTWEKKWRNLNGRGTVRYRQDHVKVFGVEDVEDWGDSRKLSEFSR